MATSRRLSSGWLSLLFCAALLAVTAAGCASDGGAADSPAFRIDPEAPTPHVVVQWQHDLTSWKYFGTQPQEFARPAHVGVGDEVVVAASNGEVAKFQAANGRLRWRVGLDEAIHAGAGIGQGAAYVGDLAGRLVALALADGRQLWEVQLGSSVETPPTYGQGRVFVTDASDTLYALDAATGKELWRFSRPPNEFFTIKGSGTPVVVDDAVYCGFSDGHLMALQIDGGDVIWEADLTAGATEFVDVDEPVRIEGDRLYAVSYAGGVYALDTFDGSVVWRKAVPSAGEMHVADEKVLVASATGRFIALDRQTGGYAWSFKTDGPVPTGIHAYGPYVMGLTADGPLYVLDGATGYPLTKWSSVAGYFAPVAFGAERAYVLNNHGVVHAVKLGW